VSALICGSIAYDNIMVFNGRFKEHILPDQIHILNVSFLVPEIRQEFGGCAGNIAYNLRLLGEEPLVMATVGRDFDTYRQWLKERHVDDRFITELGDSLTAQAYINTDLDDNQITAFHPGAMDHAHLNTVTGETGAKIGIISPDGRQGMIEHAAQFVEAGIPFMFDPGQGLPMFDGEDLRHFISQATWVAVNDYEGQLLRERTGLDMEAIAAQVEALIVTRGGKGSLIYTDGELLEIPAVPPRQVLDPTGCGDAFRAGLLFGLIRGLPWKNTGRLASLLGSKKIEYQGTQNHTFSPESLMEDFKDAFGHAISL
jgi:adenosine kinase